MTQIKRAELHSIVVARANDIMQQCICEPHKTREILNSMNALQEILTLFAACDDRANPLLIKKRGSK